MGKDVKDDLGESSTWPVSQGARGSLPEVGVGAVPCDVVSPEEGV